MKAKFVYEAFKEDSDPIEDMGIGAYFGFTKDLLGIEYNNGLNNLYIKPSFIYKINKDFTINSKRVWFNNFTAKYKGMYACSIYFILVNFDDKQLYRAVGTSGSHGFGGGQYTRRETLAKTYVKEILQQLYYKLENISK